MEENDQRIKIKIAPHVCNHYCRELCERQCTKPKFGCNCQACSSGKLIGDLFFTGYKFGHGDITTYNCDRRFYVSDAEEFFKRLNAFISQEENIDPDNKNKKSIFMNLIYTAQTEDEDEDKNEEVKKLEDKENEDDEFLNLVFKIQQGDNEEEDNVLLKHILNNMAGVD